MKGAVFLLRIDRYECIGRRGCFRVGNENMNKVMGF